MHKREEAYKKDHRMTVSVNINCYTAYTTIINEKRVCMKLQQESGISNHRDIWISTMFLCVLGLMMIFSASGSVDYFKRQLMFVLLGFLVCFIAQFMDYHMLYRYSKVIYVLSIGCIFLLLTRAGVSVNGATRWLRIAGVQFQVAEAVKIGTIVILSYMIQRYQKSLQKVKLLLWMWGLGGCAAGLLMVISNDLSSSIVVLGITFCMTFVFTELVAIHVGAVALVGSAAGIYVLSIWRNLPSPNELENMSFRVGRIAAWLSPYKYESDQSFQTLQALYAIGSGGAVGKGLGNSMQKFMIPEPHTDMIFSILCEELGAGGALILFSLLTYLIFCLLKAAMSSRDFFGYALSVGVVAHIAVQSLINLAVNLNVFPNTGIALPFISYGGTAVFTLLCEIAMVLSMSRISGGLAFIRFGKKKEAKKRRGRANEQNIRSIHQIENRSGKLNSNRRGRASKG